MKLGMAEEHIAEREVSAIVSVSQYLIGITFSKSVCYMSDTRTAFPLYLWRSSVMETHTESCQKTQTYVIVNVV